MDEQLCGWEKLRVCARASSGCALLYAGHSHCYVDRRRWDRSRDITRCTRDLCSCKGMCVSVCVCTCVCACVRVYMCVCVCVCVHICYCVNCI